MCTERKKENKLSGASSYNNTNPIGPEPQSYDLIKPYLQKATQQLRLQHRNSWREKYIRWAGSCVGHNSVHSTTWSAMNPWTPCLLILVPRATGQPLPWMLPGTVAEGIQSLEDFTLVIKCSSPEIEVCLTIHWPELVTWPHPNTRESEGAILAYSQKEGSWKYLVNSINDYHTKINGYYWI